VEAVETIVAERTAQPDLASPPGEQARPLRNLVNIAGGELARWIKITTPNDRLHVIHVLRMAADVLEAELDQEEERRELEPASDAARLLSDCAEGKRAQQLYTPCGIPIQGMNNSETWLAAHTGATMEDFEKAAPPAPSCEITPAAAPSTPKDREAPERDMFQEIREAAAREEGETFTFDIGPSTDEEYDRMYPKVRFEGSSSASTRALATRWSGWSPWTAKARSNVLKSETTPADGALERASPNLIHQGR
jgi:hypothetical protein